VGTPRTDSRLRGNIAAFWLGGKPYGLDIAVVSEVFTVGELVEVPMSPAEVVGVFSLRGSPVALIDLASALKLPGSNIDPDVRPTALILRPMTGSILAAVRVDRMHSVIDLDRGTFRPREYADEHPAVRGFLDVTDRDGLVITVLDSTTVLGQLRQLKMR
jgi:chemotaxis signal transduction protein